MSEADPKRDGSDPYKAPTPVDDDKKPLPSVATCAIVLVVLFCVLIAVVATCTALILPRVQ